MFNPMQRKPREQRGPLQSPNITPIQAAPGQAPQPGTMDMLSQMAMNKVASTGLEKGMEKVGTMYEGSALQGGVNKLLAPLMGGAAETAGTAGAASTGVLAGLGGAMPWLGAGLLGGKMLGLFSKGGLVGPLAGIKYKSNGGEVSDEVSYTFQSSTPK